MPTIVGENVRRLREILGLDQRRLAKKAGVSSVAMVESGKRPNARGKTLGKIAQALGVPVDDLYRKHDLEPSKQLQEFLSTAGRDVTAEERALLIWMSVPGREHTPQSYALLLATIRATKKP